MHKKYKIIIAILLALILLTVAVGYVREHNVAIFAPAGQVGQKERNLMFFALLLAVIVVVPTFALTIYIAWKYNEKNHTAKTKYRPDFDRSKLYEGIWWGIPIIIIGVLSVVAWNSAHALDPYKRLVSSKRPLTIQVVALDWKWLFIYPEQRVASVNEAEIPLNTPVDFHVTSDSVMNSFWVPNLGGQIYAMNGMDTQLNLMASKAGSYPGSSANISGTGFAGMTFTIKAGTSSAFNAWVARAQSSATKLTGAAYDQLAKPSTYNPVAYYSSTQNGLYNDIMMQYMMPNMTIPKGASQ